jgi:hypothetical protein
MPQQQAPFLEGKYGWNFGESGWNTGMDENLLKFSFLFDRNVDSIVASLPAAVNGQAHFLTTDNRLYFAVGTTYFSTPVPKWFIVVERSTGQAYQYNGTALVQIDSPAQLDTRLDAVELTVASLGSAAFEDVSAFATSAELDVVEGQAQGYSDALRSDIGDASDPTKGAAIVSYLSPIAGAVSRTVSEKLQERVSVKDFGAVGDGVDDDTAAIQAAIDYAANIANSEVFPYRVPVVWLPFGNYLISSPLLADAAITIDGDLGRLVGIGPAYGSRTIPLEGGGTEESKALILFLRGNKGSTAGDLRWSAKIGRGVVLDCQEFAFPAVYIERMPYSSINCEIQGSSQNGLEVGPYMWGLNLDDIVIENVSESCIYFDVDAACNGISIKNPKLWGEFKESYAGLNFADGAECNGVSVSGGFIEKVKYAALMGTTCGPVHFDGMDFEQCRNGVIRAVGDPLDARKVGPVTITNSFLDAIDGPKVYADQAVVTVEGCRMFPGSVDFQTDLNYRGTIKAINNTYPGGLGVAPGSNVVVEIEEGVGRVVNNYASHSITNFVTGWALNNYQYRDSPFLKSSSIAFQSFYVGGATEQYVSLSDWFISEYQNVTAPGVLNKKIGVRLANDAGQNAFRPITDNITSNGEAAARWTVVYAASGTINTSDIRDKQQIRDLSKQEKAVAKKLKGMIKAFKFNDAVAEKGEDARIHFGVMAQEVKSAFAEEGLDAFKYALMCYDEWEAREEVLGSDGSVILEAREAGSRYGVRYEQLLAFIISAL